MAVDVPLFFEPTDAGYKLHHGLHYDAVVASSTIKCIHMATAIELRLRTGCRCASIFAIELRLQNGLLRDAFFYFKDK